MSGAIALATRRLPALVLACLAAAALPVGMAAAAATPALAQQQAPLLHALFQDHAVLQRDQPIRVWGVAAPGETVTVELAGKGASARAGGDGRWQAQLPAMKAGGPHTLIARTAAAKQSVADVMVKAELRLVGSGSSPPPPQAASREASRTLEIRGSVFMVDGPRD